MPQIGHLCWLEVLQVWGQPHQLSLLLLKFLRPSSAFSRKGLALMWFPDPAPVLRLVPLPSQKPATVDATTTCCGFYSRCQDQAANEGCY
jgi:hypothetical protein